MSPTEAQTQLAKGRRVIVEYYDEYKRQGVAHRISEVRNVGYGDLYIGFPEGDSVTLHGSRVAFIPG